MTVATCGRGTLGWNCQRFTDLNDSMANATSSGQKSGSNQGQASCSVCLEAVKDVGERSTAKLACGHHFHLDCIGSAFNAKGTMQCPNCRRVEDGLWLYANHQLEDPLMADILHENEYGLYTGVSELFIPHDLVHFGHFQWCPYQSSYTQFLRSPGDTDRPRAAYVIVNVVLSDQLDHEAGQVLSPLQRPWSQWALAPSTAPNSIGSLELGFLRGNDGQRWAQPDGDSSQALGRSRSLHTWDNSVYQRLGDMASNTMGTGNFMPLALNHNLYAGGFVQMAPAFSPFNVSHSRRRRVLPAVNQHSNGLFVHYPSEGQMLPGSLNLEFIGVSRQAGQEDGTTFSQWSQEGWPSTLMQYPLEPEVRSWFLSPSPGSHGLHGYYSTGLPTQAGFQASEVRFATSQFPGPFQAFLAPFSAVPQVNIGSFQTRTSTDTLTR